MDDLRESLIQAFRQMNHNQAKTKAKALSGWINQHIDCIVDDELLQSSPLIIEALKSKQLVPVLLTVPWDALYQVYPGVSLFDQEERFELLANVPEIWSSSSTQKIKNLVDAWATLFKNSQSEIYIINPYWSEHAINILIQRIKGVVLKGIQITIITRYIKKGSSEDMSLERFVKFISSCGAKVNIRSPQAYIDGIHTPLIHAKVLISDNNTDYVGSANISQNGFLNSFEVGVIVEGSSVVNLKKMVLHLEENLCDYGHAYT